MFMQENSPGVHLTAVWASWSKCESALAIMTSAPSTAPSTHL